MPTFHLNVKSGISFTIQLNLCKAGTLKMPKIGFQGQLSLNAGQKYCRMLRNILDLH